MFLHFVLQYHKDLCQCFSHKTEQKLQSTAVQSSVCGHRQKNKSFTHRAQRCLCACNYSMSDQTCTEWDSIRQRHRLIEAVETHQMRSIWFTWNIHLETKYHIVSWVKLSGIWTDIYFPLHSTVKQIDQHHTTSKCQKP